MKRFSIVTGATLGCCMMASTSLGGDNGPPNFPGYSWQRGERGTTWAIWTFTELAKGGVNGYYDPDHYFNPYGVPRLDTTGATPGTIPDPNGRDDNVWCIPPGGTAGLVLTIPNTFHLDRVKDIYLQYKWWGLPGVGTEPNIMVLDPAGNMAGPGPLTFTPSVLGTGAEGHVLWSGGATFRFPYCPEFEVIKITNPNPDLPLYLTQFVIDTRCIPTPGGMALLGIAGLVASRRRR